MSASPEKVRDKPFLIEEFAGNVKKVLCTQSVKLCSVTNAD